VPGGRTGHQLRQRQCLEALHRAQHEAGIGIGHAPGVEQPVQQEVREVLQVTHVDVQQVVHVAGQCMAGHHFIPALHAVHEVADGGLVVLFQLHAHEGLQAQPQLARFQPRAIADDHALAFQPLQAAQAGRG